jgi:NitT/TauT family transport system permease protein
MGMTERLVPNGARPPQRPKVMRRTSWVLYPACAIIALVGLWQLFVSIVGAAPYVLPGPLDVIRATVQIGPTVLAQTLPTLFEIVVGFVLAVLIGVPLGVMLAAFRPFEESVYPLLVALQGIPKVALAPIFIVWFGLGYTPKVLLVLLLAFFPIVINTVAGVRSVNPAYVSLGRSMQGSRRGIYLKILLPHAMPQIFAGFKVGMSLAIIGAVVGELMGTNGGLGYVLLSATGQLQMDRAFVVIIWLGVLSIPLVGLVTLIDRFAIPWAPHNRELRARKQAV